MVDMLEHEEYAQGLGALASRTDFNIVDIGESQDHDLERTFLIKKMEIEFMLTPHGVTDDAALDTERPCYLVFAKTSGDGDSDTTTECFAKDIKDKQEHQKIIWTRPFMILPVVTDATDHVLDRPDTIVFKTSKTFPKGYPLDKDEIYAWRVFNASNNALVTGSYAYLHVRYWGKFL